MPVALVTGGNRGIGLEICRQLAARGYRVLLSARDPTKAEMSARTIEGNVQPLALDVTDAQSIANAKADASRRFGRVDVLVNNAAVLLDENRELFDVATTMFRTTMETNVIGAIAVSQAFVPDMVERRFGR